MADHPRIRGENVSVNSTAESYSGSPPHTRGKPSPPRKRKPMRRITPAYAGKTGGMIVEAAGDKDHPRIRGENPSLRIQSFSVSGSPPHTRGKLEYVSKCRKHHGITPAYAGKTFRAGFVLLVGQDHPRIRGENLTICFCEREESGSPPHTRGKPAFVRETSQMGRITPAYAGKTFEETLRAAFGEDHPRIRGENLNNL